MTKRRYVVHAIRIVAVIWLLAVVTVAALSPLLSPFNPESQDLSLEISRPGTGGHLMGTDDLGRDVFSRLIYGSRATLLVGFTATAISFIAGTSIGLFAGLSGKRTDSAVMLLLDALLSIPTILLAIAVVAFMGYGLVQVTLALGIVYAPVCARIVRAETLRIKQESFVEASRALGSSSLKTVVLHILPNILGPVVIQAAMTFSLAIVVEASLSYLGLGTQPPDSSWGLMLKDSRSYLSQAPFLSLFPGIAVTLTVFSINSLGDALSERLNPRSS